MSYSTWEIHGFGLKLTDIEEKVRLSTDEKFIRAVYQMIDDYAKYAEADTAFEHPINDHADTLARIRDALADPDEMEMLDPDDICNAFEQYEGENYAMGFSALLGDIFNYKWLADNHDNIMEVQRNDDGDGELYWMLCNVSPWHRCEFASQQDCEDTIRRCFFGVVDNDIDIDSVTIKQSG